MDKLIIESLTTVLVEKEGSPIHLANRFVWAVFN